MNDNFVVHTQCIDENMSLSKWFLRYATNSVTQTNFNPGGNLIGNFSTIKAHR